MSVEVTSSKMRGRKRIFDAKVVLGNGSVVYSSGITESIALQGLVLLVIAKLQPKAIDFDKLKEALAPFNNQQ